MTVTVRCAHCARLSLWGKLISSHSNPRCVGSNPHSPKIVCEVHSLYYMCILTRLVLHLLVPSCHPTLGQRFEETNHTAVLALVSFSFQQGKCVLSLSVQLLSVAWKNDSWVKKDSASLDFWCHPHLIVLLLSISPPATWHLLPAEA